MGISLDSYNNFYVADRGNHLIRYLYTNGIVTTIAGTAGVSGRANGLGTFSSFSFPSDIAVDQYGNAYVADQINYDIRKISSNYEVTTFAGNTKVYGFSNSVGTYSVFSYVAGIRLDSFGNLIVVDEYNNVIRKVSTSSAIAMTLTGSTVQSGFFDAYGTFATFQTPVGLCLDVYNNIYIADAGNNLIRKVYGPPFPTR